ncbi:hypothetical protein VFPFJ_02105 [Purpureocillium lilacinum]|uniref:Uncharacterized protein n=1 Tax=Purpureocillium lilacinum TaxID=33203 RepID=A0A179G1X5_PURLI|nr:hypothetical protein VFPFJ_02105 [Purpureocillium lilacinum]OAQ71874.1 hypothetical protein VFPBJ_10653 [Purpureocillium lilacinum]OAQ92944.1 hypothetical protein VFPFJ_02105 [Purpureocillium lilacinum]
MPSWAEPNDVIKGVSLGIGKGPAPVAAKTCPVHVQVLSLCITSCVKARSESGTYTNSCYVRVTEGLFFRFTIGHSGFAQISLHVTEQCPSGERILRNRRLALNWVTERGAPRRQSDFCLRARETPGELDCGQGNGKVDNAVVFKVAAFTWMKQSIQHQQGSIYICEHQAPFRRSLGDVPPAAGTIIRTAGFKTRPPLSEYPCHGPSRRTRCLFAALLRVCFLLLWRVAAPPEAISRGQTLMAGRRFEAFRRQRQTWCQ